MFNFNNSAFYYCNENNIIKSELEYGASRGRISIAINNNKLNKKKYKCLIYIKVKSILIVY